MKKAVLISIIAIFMLAPAAYALDKDAYNSRSCSDRCKARLLKEDNANLRKENERLRDRRWIKAYRSLEKEHRQLQSEAGTLRHTSRALEQRNSTLEQKANRLAAELKEFNRRAEKLMKDVRDSRTAALIYKVLYEKCVGKCPTAK